jgi:hypothetical protein
MDRKTARLVSKIEAQAFYGVHVVVDVDIGGSVVPSNRTDVRGSHRDDAFDSVRWTSWEHIEHEACVQSQP